MQPQQQKQEQKEPLRLKIIIPLLGVILILALVFTFLNVGKATFSSAGPKELHDSFNSYVTKLPDYEHYRVLTGEKKVSWNQGPVLTGMLEGIEGSEMISSVSMKYMIPVLINLVGDWSMTLADQKLNVRAPMPTFGEVALDSSSLDVQYKSPVSDEQKSVIVSTLTENLSAYRMTLDEASRNDFLTQSRAKVEELLRSWLASSYSNLPDLKMQITFSGSADSEFPEEP